jgi:hypothetical protein
MHSMKHLFVAAALAGASVSCGDVVRDGKGSALLVVDLLTGVRGGEGAPTTTLLSDVVTNGTIYNDLGQVTLRLVPKNVVTSTGPLAPTSNSDVTISRYRVSYRRSDGRNTPGVDVPWGFDGAATGTVSFGGSLVLGFELVRHVAKMETPLAQLIENRSVITTIADVTFWGRDVVGNEISATGSIQVNFGNFGDE